MRLTTRVHDRDAADMRYVYPVVSRRAGGVSVGINLNPNDACNWRCIYCQVPGLVAGKGPPIDLGLLRDELERMLQAIVGGDWMERCVPEGYRRLNDVALSGNGEPTSSPHFREAVAVVTSVRRALGLEEHVRLVLITNGSLVHLPAVQEGLRLFAAHGGEVWFKLDSATDEGLARLNSAHTGIERQLRNLRACAGIAETWIQTMALALDGQPPSPAERAAYLALCERVVREGWGVRGVLLYGLARVSHQPEAPRLAPLSHEWMEAFAAEIRARGLEVRAVL